MKEATVIETPLIGSGSQEEADNRVRILLELGTSRGFLTYEELNEKLPDEVVSPDKLDSLLMMIDEMGIKLIDEGDIGDFVKGGRRKKPAAAPVEPETIVDDEGEEIDLSGLGVEPRLQVLPGLVVLAGRGGDGLFDCADHDIGLDALFLGERFDGLLQRI